MRSPQLTELPSAPNTKNGWPWDRQSPPLPDLMPDGRQWPRISIITPSYNQGNYIEETIRSVLLQGYPDLEYIIIDGASTDQTVPVIQKYSAWLHHWVSEPDRGQSHAINKGMSQASGEIVAWLNSDDWLESDALADVAIAWRRLPAKLVGLTGACRWHHGESTEVRRARWLFHQWLRKDVYLGLQQPSTFFSREAFDSVGGVDEEMHYVMDKDLWLRFQQRGWDFDPVDRILSNFRCHEASKTTGKRPQANLRLAKENFHLRNKLLGSPVKPEYWRLMARSLAELAQAYAQAADHSLGERQAPHRRRTFLTYRAIAAVLDPRTLFRRGVSQGQ